MRGTFSLSAVTLLLLGLVHPSLQKAYSAAERRELLEEIEREIGRFDTIKRENQDNDKRKDTSDESTKVLDEKDIDPDDTNMRLLLSMGVVEDGVLKHPKGLHPDDSKKVKAESLDRTIETEEEIEKEGVPGKQVPCFVYRYEKKTKEKKLWTRSAELADGKVPYQFDASISNNRKYFLQAAELFHNLTCIRWKPRSAEVEAEVGHKGYALVRSLKGAGCSSTVGFYGDGTTKLNLLEPGCGSVRIAAHEMLHHIGQDHEQSRSDRDRYVQINWDRIDPDWKAQYYRDLTYNRNPYDIGSVMQYGYGEGGAIELRDKNLLFLEFPGNDVLSFYDLQDVLDQYDCTGHVDNRYEEGLWEGLVQTYEELREHV